jgi:hypothetical protein
MQMIADSCRHPGYASVPDDLKLNGEEALMYHHNSDDSLRHGTI